MPAGVGTTVTLHLVRAPTHPSESIFPDSVSPSLMVFIHQPRAGEGGYSLDLPRLLPSPAPALARPPWPARPPVTFLSCSMVASAQPPLSPWLQGLCLGRQNARPTLGPRVRLTCSLSFTLCSPLAVPCLPRRPSPRTCRPGDRAGRTAPRGLLSHRALRGLEGRRGSVGHTASGAHMQFGLCACPEVWGHRRHPEGSGPSEGSRGHEWQRPSQPGCQGFDCHLLPPGGD